MDLTVGSILTGKVTGITKFGAFVAVAPGKSGLVHISEIANSYVSDVNAFLSVGQEVSVKVLSIDDAGRINLSIKQALPKEASEPVHKRVEEKPVTETPKPAAAAQPSAPSFEDKLKQFMSESNSKISGLYADHRTSRKGNRR